MDSITDPSCGKALDPDMTLYDNSVPDVIMATVAAQVTQIYMAPVAAWPLDTNMVTGD